MKLQGEIQYTREARESMGNELIQLPLQQWNDKKLQQLHHQVAKQRHGCSKTLRCQLGDWRPSSDSNKGKFELQNNLIYWSYETAQERQKPFMCKLVVSQMRVLCKSN